MYVVHAVRCYTCNYLNSVIIRWKIMCALLELSYKIAIIFSFNHNYFTTDQINFGFRLENVLKTYTES